ncbi:MAG: hypothetical protein MJ123_10755 [Lachnospiraceae bacterium]|nr:hypothetical protein [Lachnospiraceae bacterium]
MFNVSDLFRNEFMLDGPLKYKGYDWWWHSFTAVNLETGDEKAFFIEFFTCNPGLGGFAPLFGQDPENKKKGIRPSYLMVKVGCWGEDHVQLHRFFPWTDVRMHPGAPYIIKADDCLASDKRLRGHVSVSKEDSLAHPEWMSDSGEMYFDLKVDKKVAFNVGYGASRIFRFLKAFEMYWHAEGMKTLYDGYVIYNGVRYEVIPERSYGYADKNWGSNFTSPWVWLSSNDLVSKRTGRQLKNSVFDIGGGRPKVYFVPLNRKLLSAFLYQGEEFEFNFSKFWTKTRTKFACKETKDEILWHVRQSNKDAMMDVKIRCKKKDMLLINYEAPDGSKLHKRLWNGGNGSGIIKLYRRTDKGLRLIDEIEAKHVGCEYGEY